MTNGAGRVLLGLSNQRKHCCVAYTDAQRSCSLVVTPCASSSSSPAAVLQGRLPRIAEQWLESFFKELQSSYSTQLIYKSIHKKPYLLNDGETIISRLRLTKLSLKFRTLLERHYSQTRASSAFARGQLLCWHLSTCMTK